jgi:hypothetical protein
MGPAGQLNVYAPGAGDVSRKAADDLFSPRAAGLSSKPLNPVRRDGISLQRRKTLPVQ